VFQKTRDHIFDDKLKQNSVRLQRFFGTLVTKSKRHRHIF